MSPRSTRARRAPAALALALLVPITACSGDDDAAPTTDPPKATTVTTPSTSSTTTTIATTTTTTTSTTIPTTTSTSTGTAPTTVPEPVDLAAAVERDWREAVRLLRLAQMDPADDVRRADALRYRSGDNLIQVAGFLESLRQASRRILEEPIADPALTFEVGPSAVDDGSNDVYVQVCEVDPWILVESDEGGSERVISDIVVANRDRLRMRSINGLWTIFDRERLGTWEGVLACAADS